MRLDNFVSFDLPGNMAATYISAKKNKLDVVVFTGKSFRESRSILIDMPIY